MLARLIVSILFLGVVARGADIPFDLTEDEKVLVTCNRLLVLTHPSETFDQLGESEPGVQHLLRWLGEVPFVDLKFLLAGESSGRVSHDESTYFVGRDDVDEVVCSKGGGHSLFMMGQGQLVLAGGHWNQCQVRTLRLFLAQSRSIESLTVFFVSDAIYTNIVRGEQPMKLSAVLHFMPEKKRKQLLETYVAKIFLDMTKEGEPKGPDRNDFNLSLYFNNDQIIEEDEPGRKPLEIHILPSMALEKYARQKN